MGQAVSLLFGLENSIVLNGLSKLVGRFNSSVVAHKFVVCEEVVAKPGTEAGNSIKSLITEKAIAVEGKGRETTSTTNRMFLLMTTNHYPGWIEPDDRRIRVFDTNHSGNASGPAAKEFQDRVANFLAYLQDEKNVARIYNGLMQRQPSSEFNPRTLNVSKIDTPIMQTIHNASGEVILQELKEWIDGEKLFAIPQSRLRQILVERFKANPNRLTHLMIGLGWVARKVKWGGKDYARMIWVHPDYQVADGRVIGPSGYDEPVVDDEDEFKLI